MEPIWLKSYPPGVLAEIDMTQFRLLGRVRAEAGEIFRASPISIWARITYELDRQSRNFGALQSVCKLPEGASR